MKEYEDLGYKYIKKEFVNRFTRYMMVALWVGIGIGMVVMYFAKP